MKKGAFFALICLFLFSACATTQSGARNSDPCADFELDVQKVWSAEAKARVEYGFMKYGGELGAKKASAVTTQMDNLTRDWVMMRQAACRDYHVRKLLTADEYKQKAACLDGALAKTRALLAALETGNDAIIAQLTELVSKIGECQ